MEFEELKSYYDKKPKLSPIQPGMPIQLYTDASIDGLGFLLMQDRKAVIDEKETTIRDMVNMGSTSLTKTKQRYLPIESEYLALKTAVKKNHFSLFKSPIIEHFTDST